MPRPKRIIHDTLLDEAIKDAAWIQVQESGAAAFSLRGIARQLGISAPSIYRYYPNRDALVTALILDAFASLAESQHIAFAAAAEKDYPAQLAALALAYRRWAISHPQHYQLILGTPIPGYIAPEELTLPAAAAGFVPLVQTLQVAFQAGRLRLERLAPMTAALREMLDAWAGYEGQTEGEVLYIALVFWSRIHGLVIFELNGQNPSFIADPSEIYEREVNNIVIQYFGMETE